ncbi:MAG TPA: NAD(P)H-dependent oxidoreductase [Phycisphaerae bacterium]|nr:NAD(P)H-dependent oxidoreductase [Phycisphaerae bacterium]
MKPVDNDIVLKQLQWRYAVKKFDPTRKISPEDWRTLEQALVLTPSSFGLQPWRFVVVTDQRVKDQLVAASWNQRQVADASHVVVFAIRRNLSADDIDRYLSRVAAVRGVGLDALDGFRKMMVGSLTTPRAGFDVNDWSARQVYIALGHFMFSAAMLGIDTCPMEGIEPAQYDEILRLPKDGYAAQVVATAGYRAADDKYALLPKVRFSASDVIQRIA